MQRRRIESLREERLDLAHSIASRLEANRDGVVEILSRVEPWPTALDEVQKTIRALRSYEKELPALEGRTPFGDVVVALPFNNPLYSLVLYAYGVAIGGSDAYVRPSRHSAQSVREIYAIAQREFIAAGVHLVETPGPEAIQRAILDDTIQSLIFTGSFANVSSIMADFPPAKRLIYCGSGVNPYVVGTGILQAEMIHVARIAAQSRLYNSGQDCLCSERFFVHQSVASSFTESLKRELETVTVGSFGDQNAQVTPLLDSIAQRAKEYLRILQESATPIYVSLESDNLIGPHAYIVDKRSEVLHAEKFCPLFTVCIYEDNDELDELLRSDYRFGATVMGEIEAGEITGYPHVTWDRSVIDLESDDAHVPFGGRKRSGFSRRGESCLDGPILYSVETTEAIDGAWCSVDNNDQYS